MIETVLSIYICNTGNEALMAEKISFQRKLYNFVFLNHTNFLK